MSAERLEALRKQKNNMRIRKSRQRKKNRDIASGVRGLDGELYFFLFFIGSEVLMYV